VSRLYETCSHTIRKAIGIEQIRALRAGDCDEKTCLQKIIEATRQYAKRQETWFRRESWLTPAPALDHRACAEAFGGMIQE
jgi:tRNA dimethylallyltransferase